MTCDPASGRQTVSPSESKIEQVLIIPFRDKHSTPRSVIKAATISRLALDIVCFCDLFSFSGPVLVALCLFISSHVCLSSHLFLYICPACISLILPLPLSPSLLPSLCLSLCLSFSVCLSLSLSVCLSLSLCLCLSVCLSVCLPACLPAYLPTCLSVSLPPSPPPPPPPLSLSSTEMTGENAQN